MPFGADTPTPEFVGNSRVRGARSPPGTPRDLTPPPGHSRAAAVCSCGGPGLRAGGVPGGRSAGFRRLGVPGRGGGFPGGGAPGRAVGFRRQVYPAGGRRLPGGCARAGFRRASGRRVGVPAWAAKNRPPGEKKPVFFRPLRACIRKRGLLFRKKNR